MTQATTPAIVLTEGTLKGDVFYGSFDATIKSKRYSIIVSNHIKETDKQYNFRVATKCKAGFISISDFKSTPENLISSWKKNALINVQVEVEYENGNKGWYNVFTTKGNRWYSIDLGFLKVISVGSMRQSFPEMCDMRLFELVGAKTWADKAFIFN